MCTSRKRKIPALRARHAGAASLRRQDLHREYRRHQDRRDGQMAGLHEEKHEQDKKQLTQGDPHAVPVREEKKLPAQRGEDRSGIHHQLRLGERGNILSYRELVIGSDGDIPCGVHAGHAQEKAADCLLDIEVAAHCRNQKPAPGPVGNRLDEATGSRLLYCEKHSPNTFPHDA